MKHPVSKVLSLTLWMARGTATMMGFAMMVAVVFGVGTTALAAVPGDPFKLGRINSIGRVTQLVGTTNNALLRVDNGSKGPDATALDLRVDPKRPPLKTNSLTKVENLHTDLLDGRSADQFATGIGGTAVEADKLDGKDSTAYFSADNTYFDTADAVGGQGGGTVLFFIGAPCDPGDRILNAGGGANPEDEMIEERPVGASAWLVRIRDNGAPTTSTVAANCLDFPPLR